MNAANEVNPDSFDPERGPNPKDPEPFNAVPRKPDSPNTSDGGNSNHIHVHLFIYMIRSFFFVDYFFSLFSLLFYLFVCFLCSVGITVPGVIVEKNKEPVVEKLAP